jgi:hypothetical protein
MGATSGSDTVWGKGGNVNDDLTGILIGIGTTAPTRTDYAMESKIAHGTGVGQMTHNLQTYTLIGDTSFKLTREFTNAGSIINVAEAGMYYKVSQNKGAPYTYLLARDTFAPIAVAAGNGVRAIYTFSF